MTKYGVGLAAAVLITVLAAAWQAINQAADHWTEPG
jgi:hypothetical protein